MGLIKIDYDKAARQAKRLRKAAEDCDDACRQLDYLLSNMHANWQGESAKQFEAELNKWKIEQISIKNELTAISNSIETVAREFKEAEDRITAQAKGGGGGR